MYVHFFPVLLSLRLDIVFCYQSNDEVLIRECNKVFLERVVMTRVVTEVKDHIRTQVAPTVTGGRCTPSPL